MFHSSNFVVCDTSICYNTHKSCKTHKSCCKGTLTFDLANRGTYSDLQLDLQKSSEENDFV